MAQSPCWSKLRERSTLLTNEQCLLDLDERVAALEARAGLGLAMPSSAEPLADVPPEPSSAAPEPSPLSPPPERHEPIPISQRLPELHELDAEGRCWAYRNASHEPHGKAWILGTPVSLQLTRPWCSFSHWLPYWALPIVADAAASPAASA